MYAGYCLSLHRRSDHSLVLLTAEYIHVIQRQPVTTRLVRRWTQEGNEALHDWLESTNWNTLWESYGEDINSMTERITEFITFWVNNTLPVKAVRCFPNNKPWITRDLKELLNKKQRGFRTGDRSELRWVHNWINKEVGYEASAIKQRCVDWHEADHWLQNGHWQTKGSLDRANEPPTEYSEPSSHILC